MTHGAMWRFSRRGFLKKTLGTAWAGAALMEQATMRAAAARAQASAAGKAGLPKLFDIEKAAEGAWLAKARSAALINCNAAIFEQSGGMLVVDTHSKPSAAAALVRQLGAEVTKKPVRWVVNSHFHWDHTQGTPVYKKLTPKPEIVASETTRRLLGENGSLRLKISMDEAAKSLDEYAAKAGAAKTPAEKAYWQRMSVETKAFLAEMKGFQFELPDITLTSDLTLHDAAQELHIAFRGRAHTAGDIVVYSPSRKVISTGDMLQGLGPFLGDGYPKEWPNTLLSVAEFDFDKVLGGHGRVHERALLYQMRDYLEELWIAVERGQRRKGTLEQLQKDMTAERFVSLKSGYGAATVSVLREFTMQPPGTTDAEILEGLVKGNLADVWKRLEES